MLRFCLHNIVTCYPFANKSFELSTLEQDFFYYLNLEEEHIFLNKKLLKGKLFYYLLYTIN